MSLLLASGAGGSQPWSGPLGSVGEAFAASASDSFTDQVPVPASAQSLLFMIAESILKFSSLSLSFVKLQ